MEDFLKTKGLVEDGVHDDDGTMEVVDIKGYSHVDQGRSQIVVVSLQIEPHSVAFSNRGAFQKEN